MVRPRLSRHDLQQVLSWSPRYGTRRLWYIVRVSRSLYLDPLAKPCKCLEPRSAVGSLLKEHNSPVPLAVLHCLKKRKLGAVWKNRENFWTPLSQNTFAGSTVPFDTELQARPYLVTYISCKILIPHFEHQCWGFCWYTDWHSEHTNICRRTDQGFR